MCLWKTESYSEQQEKSLWQTNAAIKYGTPGSMPSPAVSYPQSVQYIRFDGGERYGSGRKRD